MAGSGNPLGPRARAMLAALTRAAQTSEQLLAHLGAVDPVARDQARGALRNLVVQGRAEIVGDLRRDRLYVITDKGDELKGSGDKALAWARTVAELLPEVIAPVEMGRGGMKSPGTGGQYLQYIQFECKHCRCRWKDPLEKEIHLAGCPVVVLNAAVREWEAH